MAGKIFINYRRDDSISTAGRLHDRLAQTFGRKNLFMDVDHIPAGVDFVEYLHSQVAACGVFLAVIGPNWLDAKDDDGRRRFDNPDDFVTIEIAAALARKIRVIPVLVDGARTPKADKLPDSVKPLVRRNAVEIRNTQFGRDAEALVEKIREALSDKPARVDRWRAGAVAGAAAALLLVGWIRLYGTAIPVSLPWAAQPDTRQQAETERLAAARAEEERKAAAAAEEERRKQAEAKRQAGEAEQQRLAALAAEEEQRKQAEAKRQAEEAERQRLAALAAEEERRKQAAAEAAARSDFDFARQIATKEVWDAFLKKYRGGHLADLARAERDRLAAADAKGAATSPPSNAPTIAAPPAPDKPPAAARIDPADAPAVTWKLQNAFPERTPTTLPLFVKRVGELSVGRMKVELLSAGAVVPGFQLVDAVRSGILDLAYGPGTFFYGKDKAFALMTGIPFGFEPRDHLAFRRRPDVAAIFDPVLAREGVVALPCGSFGRTGELWLRKPLTRTGGLAGAKLRFVGLAVDIYKEIGSAVTILPGGEIVSAIDRRLLDGAQYIDPKNDADLGFPEVAKYYYHPASVVPAYVLDLFIPKSKWDRLAPAGRQIVQRACDEAADAMVDEYEGLNSQALAGMTGQGVTVAPLPMAVQRDLHAASRKVLAKTAGENDVFRAVMAIVDEMRSSTVAAKIR
jgi:TRAP-type mannitol/chloroaromatic compound transport system substrate-binding protein